METEQKVADNKLPQTSQVLEIGGKDYTFEYNRMGIVKMLDADVDFEDIRINKNGTKIFFRKLDVLFMGALWKNHQLSTKDCGEIADKALQKYSVEQLFLMFMGLYNSVFIAEGEKIPLAQQTLDNLKETIKQLNAKKKKQ